VVKIKIVRRPNIEATERVKKALIGIVLNAEIIPEENFSNKRIIKDSLGTMKVIPKNPAYYKVGRIQLLSVLDPEIAKEFSESNNDKEILFSVRCAKRV